ncbi:DUF3140 domain-containing protein [Marivita sp.]
MEESRSVGDNDEDESTVHESVRRIIKIRDTNKDDLSDNQRDHMS